MYLNISNPTTYLLSLKIHVFHFGLSDLINSINIDIAICQWAGRIVLYTNLKNLMSKILENCYSLLYLRLDQCVIYLIERAWWEGRKARRKQQTPFFSFFFSPQRLWEVLILIIRETWKLYKNSHCLHLQRP